MANKNEEVLIPLGVDGSKTFEELNKVIGSMESLENKAKEAEKTLNDAMSKGAEGAKKFENAVKPSKKGVEDLNTAAKVLNDTLKDTEKSGAGLGKGVSKSANDYNKALKGSSSVTMEFNRIIQDAPFGMMGISNNLTQLVDNYGAYKKQLASAAAEQGKTVSSFAALKGAITGIFSPINLLPLGIAAVTSAWIAYTNWQQKAKKEKEAMTKASKEYIDTLEGERKAYADSLIQISQQSSGLRVLYAATQNQTLAMKDRLAAAQLLKQEFPDTFKNLSNEAIVAGKAASAYDRLAASIIASAKASAYRKSIEENEKKIINLIQKNEDEQARIDKLKSERTKQQIKDQSNSNEYVKAYTTLNKDGLGDVGKAVKKITTEYKFYDEAIEAGNNNLKKTNKEIDNLNKQNEKFAKNAFTGSSKIIPDTKRADAAAEKARKKAEADAKKAQKEAEKGEREQEQLNKQINAQTIAYTRQLEDLKLNAMKDGLDKQRELIKTEYKRKIEDLENDKSLTAENEQKKLEIETALRAERDKKILESEKEFEKKRLELQMEAQKTIEQYKKENLESELIIIDLDHKSKLEKLKEQYKDEQELLADLEAGLIENTERKKQEVTKKFKEKELDDQEKYALTMIEYTSLFGIQNEKAERAKQQLILQTKLEYAQKSLDLLLASGATEQDLTVLNAKTTIEKLKKEIQETNKNGEKFDIFDFLGLGDLSTENKNKIIGAAKEIYSNVQQIASFVVSQYDRMIDKQQEKIDALDDEIDNLADQLDKEKELRDNGFANNVELIEQELAEKQRQKDEEVKQQEELIEKKKKLQMAQMAVDTALQLVNMITASTEIFKSFASIPFGLGIPLAIATVATMFGAFATAKIQAAQAIKDGNGAQFGEGGWIDGKPHSQGGVKYKSVDGKNIELEGKEFVVRTAIANKYPNFIEAFNAGELHKNERALKELLDDLGISFNPTISEDMPEIVKNNEIKLNLSNNNDGTKREIQELKGIVKNLLDEKKNSPVSWEDDLYHYTKIGSKTTRVKKRVNEITN